MNVFLSFTTVPERAPRAIYIVRTLLDEKSKGKLNFTKLFLSIPLLYRTYGILPLKYILELQKIEQNSNGAFHLIRPLIDYGPITKLLPILENTRKYKIEMDKSILVIFDDDCYHTELVQQAIEHQLQNLNTTFTYYQYKYQNVNVPQGVDLITFYMKHLQDFVDYERQIALSNLDSSCFYVDDLVIGNYLKQKGIPIQTLDRGNYKWPWIPNCVINDKHSLYQMNGPRNRDTVMDKCYKYLCGG